MVFYGGSYAKKTIISDSYDLDIVMYWKQNYDSLANLFSDIGDELNENWNQVNPKKVAWQIYFPGNFHIDVVPGIALDNRNEQANLYNYHSGGTLVTNVKMHKRIIKQSDRTDVIRLVKLWKVRNDLPFKSFVLEQMVIQGCKGTPRSDLENQLTTALDYIYTNIGHLSMVDPANANNIISGEMNGGEKQAVRNQARHALDANSWREAFVY